jgi:DNA ligase-1
MADLQDGQSVEMQGSGSKPYILKNVGGVYSCSCPAWRNQSNPPERRTCKHLRKLRGDAAEEARLQSVLPATPVEKVKDAAAPAVLLAESWDNALDPTGWWLSEKLDGVRAYWDGERFWSRNGKLYHAPEWFAAGLPTTALDGELWIGRKQFQKTTSVVRRQDRSDHWQAVRYVVFDAPRLEKPFEARQEFVRECLASAQAAYALTLEQQRCHGIDHLRAELARLEALGAEGLMMRKPGSRYEGGRSATLLKVKSFHDAEARVLEHVEGAGKHKGRLGALFVELPTGTRFSVGTGFSDAERNDPPPVGSTITFRYQELSDGGVPRFPSFVGVREIPEAPAAKPAPAVKAAPAARRFELSDGKSEKFWEVAVQGKEVTVRYGRTGSDGQTSTQYLVSAAAATAHADKLVKEKTAKGYQEV